jgi:rhamnulokinase
MKTKTFIAVDMGAESGRVIAGRLFLDEDRLETRLIRQFKTGLLPAFGSLRWNVYRFLEEILEGMRECDALYGSRVDSIGFDTWGVDFGLLSPDGALLELPVSYRDPRTEGMADAFAARMPRERLYELSGVQILELNTLFQLHAMVRSGAYALKAAKDLLFLPDLFNYLLSGKKKTEYTIATTSQLLNCRTRNWDREILSTLGVPAGLMQDLVPPGTILGDLTPAVQEHTGLSSCAVTTVGCHDTASAVAAAPAEGEGWAYISSGTWSLVGVESADPVITPESFAFNLANEGGVRDTLRVLKNMAGLWILQRYRAAQPETAGMDYETLVKAARPLPDFRSLVDPDDPRFFNPRDMAGAVREYCRATSQDLPESPADFVTAILSSLALKYRHLIERLGRLTGRAPQRLHIIGGGARNRVLNQFTANATGLPVAAGPFEATAAGNLLVQAMGLGVYGSLGQIRRVVRNSFEVNAYPPQDTAHWSAGYDRFRKLLTPSGD